ncbi:hypothetical protein CDC45_09985 [Ralstonia pseudosolanacearum]|nr:hypothetical protein CDC45_09985 [Ralstonia pseudosolanacearum]
MHSHIIQQLFREGATSFRTSLDISQREAELVIVDFTDTPAVHDYFFVSQLPEPFADLCS